MRTYLLLLLSVSLLGACAIEGERSMHGCPADEICSPATPHGLLFSGAGLAGTFDLHPTSLPAVAVGGIQRVRISTQDGDILPLFDAVSSTGSIAIDRVVSTEVTVRGASSGQALLRILDRADGGTLLDRTSVAAGVIARTGIAPSDDALVTLARVHRETLFEPGDRGVAIELFDASGQRLVDEAMTIDSGTITATVGGWDSIHLTVPAEGLDLAVHAGGTDHTVHVGVPTAVDGVELVDWLVSPDAAGTPVFAPGAQVCAYPLQGGARIVPGTSFAATFTLGTTTLARDASASWLCASLPDDAPLGAARLTVAIGSASASFDISISDSGSSSSPLIESGTPRAWVAGDRAGP